MADNRMVDRVSAQRTRARDSRAKVVAQLVVVTAFACLLLACSSSDSTTNPPSGTNRLVAEGGALVVVTDRESLAVTFDGLQGHDLERAALGERIFAETWVAAPNDVAGERDGLGPLMNASSCAGCHLDLGRGEMPATARDPARGLLVRLFGPDGRGDPVYGTQLQDRGIVGVRSEATIRIDWEEIPGRYDDGTPYGLRRPVIVIEGLSTGPLHAQTSTALRLAPPLTGLGLLEGVPDAALQRLSDADDLDGDGVSGRLATDEPDGPPGRFGWKAPQPTVLGQTAQAFLEDLGVTTAPNPKESCALSTIGCFEAASGGAPEMAPERLDALVWFLRTRAVPGAAPTGTRGEAMFRQARCASCHAERLPSTPAGSATEVTIAPFTDLLLHDLGPGLADATGEASADAAEWRTAPLWGIRYSKDEEGRWTLLHDGRARSVDEAILWHGGEAAASREAFKGMPAADRVALVEFVATR